MAKGIAEITVGGVKHRLRCELSLACDIEDATGVGVIALAGDFYNSRGQFRHAVEIINAALSVNGVRFERPALMAELARDGLMASNLSAARILAALMDKPESAASGKKSNGAASTSTASPSQSTSAPAH